jgi:hypothetical protein
MNTFVRCLRFSMLAAAMLAAGRPLQAAEYVWTGAGADANWNNTNNWSPSSAYPRVVGDAATFSAATPPRQPTLNVSVTVDVVNLTGPTNWTIDIANSSILTLSAPGGINHATAFSNTINARLAGSMGIAITSGVLVLKGNNGSGNLFTGGIVVTGGVLDVSATAFNTNAVTAAGSNATAVILGDVGAGLDAELRLKGNSTRGVTVQGGAGERSVQFLDTGSATYSGPFTLNHDTVFSSWNNNFSSSLAGLLSGTGGVIVAGGYVRISTNLNSYSGRTIVNGGRLWLQHNVVNVLGTNAVSALGTPTPDNWEILLGDTSGASDASIGLDTGLPLTINRPVRVRAGSTGGAYWWQANGAYAFFQQPVTLEKTLTFVGNQSNGGGAQFFSNLQVQAGCTAGVVAAFFGGVTLMYTNAVSPTHNGGTIVSNNCRMQWKQPLTAGAPLVGSFGTGPIVLGLGTGPSFQLFTTGSGTSTLTNTIVAVGDNGALYSDPMAATITNIFTGMLYLSNRVTLGTAENNSNEGATRYQGAITIDQTSGGRRGLKFTKSNSYYALLEGATVDGAGPAHNSLLLWPTFGPVPMNGAASSYAYGTVVEGDFNGWVDVRSSGATLGSGNLWLLESGRMRLQGAANLNTSGGATVTLYGNQASMSQLSLTNNFVPVFASDSCGILNVDGVGFSAVSSLADLGRTTYLGSQSGGTFSGATLAPCADGVYRLGGGGGTLTISSSPLNGASSTVQAGVPAGGFLIPAAYGTVKLTATNGYGGGSVVHYQSTLQGTAQTSGSPFGGTAGITINGGSLQLDGITAAATNAIGTVTVNGVANLTVSQGNTRTNVLVLDTLAMRTGWAPAVVTVAGSSVANLGAKERIVVGSNPPAVNNNMVAPWFVYRTTPDFVTYSTTTDTAGTNGFVSAAGSYVGVKDTSTLQGVGPAGIANVTNIMTLTGDASVHALRLAAGAVSNNAVNHTLTVASGGVMASAACTLGSSNHLSFGSAEGVFYLGSALTVNGRLIGTNGFTKAGAATLTLRGDSSATLTGTVAVLQGRVYTTSDNQLGDSGNLVYLDGGTLQVDANVSSTRPFSLGRGGGGFIGETGNSGYRYTLNGPITGPGLFCFLNSSYPQWLRITNPNNTYEGGTAHQTGSMLVDPTSTLGVGDVAVNGTLFCFGDRNIGGGDCYGSNTVSRQARLSIYGAGSVYFICAAPSVGSLSGSGNLYLSNTVLSVGGDGSSAIYAGLVSQSPAASTGSIAKVGSGTFTFKGFSTAVGTNLVNGGTLVVDGTLAGPVSVATGTLAGAGNVGAVTLASGAALNPGASGGSSLGTLTASGLTLSSGATVNVTIASATSYDQLVVNGPVSLGGATLQASFLYKPASTDVFYIVLNGSTNLTTGTFGGMAEGKRVALGGGYYGRIGYTATGDATATNDVRIYDVSTGAPGTTIFFR